MFVPVDIVIVIAIVAAVQLCFRSCLRYSRSRVVGLFWGEAQLESPALFVVGRVGFVPLRWLYRVVCVCVQARTY